MARGIYHGTGLSFFTSPPLCHVSRYMQFHCLFIFSYLISKRRKNIISKFELERLFMSLWKWPKWGLRRDIFYLFRFSRPILCQISIPNIFSISMKFGIGFFLGDFSQERGKKPHPQFAHFFIYKGFFFYSVFMLPSTLPWKFFCLFPEILN